MAKKVETKKNYLDIISKIFLSLFAVVTIFFILRVATMAFLPAKFFYPLVIGLVVLVALSAFFILRHKNKTLKTIFSIVSVIFTAILAISTFKINEFANFLNKNLENKKSYSIYNLIVDKDSEINSISDLKNPEIFTYEEPVKEISDAKLKETVATEIPDSTLIFKDDLSSLMERVTKITDTTALINNGTYESYISVNEGYEDEIKIIATIKIEIEGKVGDETEEVVADNIANTPFILFINGIDTRTGTMPSRSLSDVNILAAVNPKTKKILLVAIPRDTYVQLHDTTGLMDKLTHAGSRGGVELSKATIEDFMGVKIDKYIRVNFNFVKNLVDSIGGITITNYENYAVTIAGRTCTFNPGDNNVDGRCALAFARERKSYSTGDRHRGENQEQVIERLIDKISKDSNIINSYSSILSALDGSFDTDITTEDIAAIVRLQLDTMSSWKVEKYNINGQGAMSKTYSYPGRDLYVLMPDITTVVTAKKKIEAIISE